MYEAENERERERESTFGTIRILLLLTGVIAIV